MPTLRHDDVRDELFAGLSDAGRRRYEAFATVYEARQIASGLAELRTTAKLSQREAAKRAGVDQADLSRIESAQITPSLPTLLRLLDAVGGTLVLARKTAPPGRTPKLPRTTPALPARRVSASRPRVADRQSTRAASLPVARPARPTQQAASGQTSADQTKVPAKRPA